MAGFKFVKSRSGGRDILRKRQIAASVTVSPGDALEVVDGKYKRVNAAADSVAAIAADAEVTSTATSLSEINIVDTFGNIFEIEITPLINDVAASGGSTTTVQVALTDGVTDDLKGGLVYVNGQQRVISANTYSSNVVTITVLEPFTAAIASGDKVRVVPYGFGTTALKLDGTDPHKKLSNAIADISGGKVAIYDVDLAKKIAHVYFI